VAKSDSEGRKPRVRKSAPTVRERNEAVRVKEESAKPGRVKSTASLAAKPVKKLRLGDRKPIKLAAKPFRLLKKVLAWIVPSYFINSWREVKQVQWPGRKETWRLTLAVFIFAIVFGALVAGVDKGLDEIFKKVVLK
jgi:preprotein translocase SecE subunit